ncbi:MAG: hypothetical protein QOF89_5970 [Acidobacteriota bacterium]|nr:hypothetical protein [Acidobacteriota bacterium]
MLGGSATLEFGNRSPCSRVTANLCSAFSGSERDNLASWLGLVLLSYIIVFYYGYVELELSVTAAAAGSGDGSWARNSRTSRFPARTSATTTRATPQPK